MSLASDLETLRSLSDNPKAFEVERCRIIGDYLNSLPHERRLQGLAFQMKLDQKREELTSTDFIEYLLNQIRLNVDRITTLSKRAKDIIEDRCNPQNVTYIDDFRRDGVSKKATK